MNIGRYTLLILISCLAGGVGPVLSQTRLSDSEFEDWTALVNETVLPDGSVLFDYTARTFSGRTEGAMLAISFVPRFNCAPTVALRKRAGTELATEAVTLEITVDSESMQYDGLVDKAGDYVSYALGVSSDVQEQLRKKMDAASRISFKVLVPDTDDSGSDAAESIAFSLLGSQQATLSAEEHCRAHEPLEFSPQ